jgi:hypothetical protein
MLDLPKKNRILIVEGHHMVKLASVVVEAEIVCNFENGKFFCRASSQNGDGRKI